MYRRSIGLEVKRLQRRNGSYHDFDWQCTSFHRKGFAYNTAYRSKLFGLRLSLQEEKDDEN